MERPLRHPPELPGPVLARDHISHEAHRHENEPAQWVAAQILVQL